MQLDLLWQFMQADMEADRFETEMRQASNRQKLLKHRSFLMDQQNNMKRIESDISVMSDRFAAIEDETARLTKITEAQALAFEEDPPEGKEETEKMIAQIQKLVDTLARYEQELAKLKKDAEARDRQQKEIRVRAAKAKAEYDALKLVYDKEFKECSGKLKALRDAAERESKGINAQLLEKYKTIKQHSTPPMALLAGDQCGGCFMSLPSVMLRDIRSGDSVVECDNCGRILYVPEDGREAAKE